MGIPFVRSSVNRDGSLDPSCRVAATENIALSTSSPALFRAAGAAGSGSGGVASQVVVHNAPYRVDMLQRYYPYGYIYIYSYLI